MKTEVLRELVGGDLKHLAKCWHRSSRNANYSIIFITVNIVIVTVEKALESMETQSKQ